MIAAVRSEKTKWANQILCLGIWTIPHKGREARTEMKRGHLELPYFLLSCFFNLSCSPMSPYQIFRVTSFALALVGEVSFSRTSSECLEATLVTRAENKSNKARLLIQLAKGKNGRF